MTNNNYIVYMHVSPSNKRYIGITGKTPAVRWRRKGKGYFNNPHFMNAINKYGWDNFEHIILHKNLCLDEAKILECKYIDQYNTTNPEHGYNRTPGGDMRGPMTDEQREKQRIAHIGIQAGEKHGMYGRKMKDVLGQDDYQKWIASVRLGHTKTTRKVVCVTTGEVFNSMTDACNTYNILKGNLISCCKRRICYCGRHPITNKELVWQYYEDYQNGVKPKKNSLRRPIVCTSTGECFASVTDAAKKYGINVNCLSSCLTGKHHYTIDKNGQKLQWVYT